MNRSQLRRALGCALLLCLWPSLAAAQLDDDLIPPARDFSSPVIGLLSFRVAPYRPNFDGNAAFEQVFGNDPGLMLTMELGGIVYRLPDIMMFGITGQFGWANYSGNTIDTSGNKTSEETDLTLIPLTALAQLRFDALPRNFKIPLTFTGKVGYQWTGWDTDSGGKDEAHGWALGLAWAGEIALDLNTFDASAARIMDEEWGINYAYLFFEVFGFHPSPQSLEVGDITFGFGIGFIF
jgi:hypothetical protein